MLKYNKPKCTVFANLHPFALFLYMYSLEIIIIYIILLFHLLVATEIGQLYQNIRDRVENVAKFLFYQNLYLRLENQHFSAKRYSILIYSCRSVQSCYL